ncbi:MAG: S-layer homology domain-containing protein [Oscillospiraceae bacterium]
MKYGNGNTGRTVVNIDGTPVWKDGKMVSHAIDTTNDKYTDGYKDNAFTVEKNGNTVTKTCQYCGWKETKQDWNINVSKTATNLKKDANGDYKTNVTLSVPGVEESLATDVVFVLDKSTSAALEEKAIAMLEELKAQTENTGATVKVGVVIFNKEANVTPLTDLATGYDTIKSAIEQTISSGTNTHAGMLAGKQLLDGDDSVAPNRKYLIFVSDGISYMYDEDGKIVPYYWMNDRSPYYSADPYSWSFKYKDNNPPENWSTWVTQIGNTIAKENVTPILYTEHKDAVANKTVDINNYKDVSALPADEYTTSVDRALYYTYQTYAAAQAKGYNCYAVVNNEKEKPSEYPWGPAFMRYLAGGEKVDFSKIQNDILYAVDAGSYVVDVIGDDFTLDVSTLKLKVGNDELTGTFDESTNAWSFGSDVNGNARFTAAYDVARKTLTWTFGEAVSNFAPVQLSYTLKLTTPETRPGTYGQLDLNGNGYIEDKDGKDTETKVDPEKEALYTNKSATLTPVDSNGKEGVNKDFPMPSVEYTVKNPYRPPVNPGIGDEIIVEITGNSDSVVYDGTEHSVKDYTVKISDPRYTEKDFTFTGKAEASGINAGTYEMGLKAEQFKNTNARFTNVKFVIKADGVLTITPKELIITAGSKTEYGPTPVTCDEWTVSGLAAGDKVESVKITGIQSVPGSSPNVPSDAVIKNAKGEDVTKNYAIKYVNGTLTMLEVLNKEDHFNYIIGTPEGLSLPTANVTRAEVATIFFRLMTDDARAKFDSLDNNFSDVAKGQWYNRAISTLANAGIIKGDPAGTYRPGDPITRAEMAAIIARFGDFKEGGKTFNDISGHWAQKYIELAASNGWINGNPDGTFKPNNNITRAETVAMINRVLDRQTKDVSDLLPVSQMTNWSDNMDTAKWYYRDMQEATNNHKAERVGDSIYEKWTEKLPDIDWASYQI